VLLRYSQPSLICCAYVSDVVDKTWHLMLAFDMTASVLHMSDVFWLPCWDICEMVRCSQETYRFVPVYRGKLLVVL